MRHILVEFRILYEIKFLKNFGISPAVSLKIVRMNQFQLRFFPWYTWSLVLLMIRTPKTNQLKIPIFPHYHFHSSFILTQFVKEEIQEIHAIFLPKRHHLVPMSSFYCIRTRVVVCSWTNSMIQTCLYLMIECYFYQHNLGTVYLCSLNLMVQFVQRSFVEMFSQDLTTIPVLFLQKILGMKQ